VTVWGFANEIDALSNQSAKAMTDVNAVMAGRIIQGIIKIPKGDIVPLKGAPGTFRLRVGDWRILFSNQDDDTVLIEKIAPRGDVYKGV